MTDFDPDAYLQQQTSQPSQAFDPDAYLAQGTQATASLKVAPDWLKQSDQPIQSMGTAIPQAAGQVLGMPGKALTNFAVNHGVSNPYLAASIGVIPDLAEDALMGGRLGKPPGPPMLEDAQSIVNRATASPGQSISAAVASPNVASASPELQAAIRTAAQKNGGIVNPDALGRHLQADTLPVPVRLSEGQALQDPTIISHEMNTRGASPESTANFSEQNNALKQNLQVVRDQVGPEVFSANPVEHGDTLIKAYQDKDAAAQANISAKYQALKDAGGGQFPVDAQALLANSTAALHQNLLFDHAPPQVMATLGRLANQDSMTMENFESLRTNLARIQRSPGIDGNTQAAAGVIRNQMEQLPLQPWAASIKPLADDARAAAKAQFSAMEADPAYKAAVNESVPPDRFVQRFITGPSATRDGVTTMRQNLTGNDTAQQTMSVAALDHLRTQAGVDPMGNGNFTQAGFNKALQAIGPKIPALFDPKTADTLQNLGDVSRYTQFQPRGAFVNNSNTLTGAIAEQSKNLAEHGTNMVFHGMPVGTIARGVLKGRALRSAVKDTWAPGAGLDLVGP